MKVIEERLRKGRIKKKQASTEKGKTLKHSSLTTSVLVISDFHIAEAAFRRRPSK